MHHFFLFSLHVTAHSHPIYETPYGTVRHNVMETWAPISKSNVARDGKNENKLYGHRKPCHTLWTLKPCVKFQTVMWTLAVSNFERHSTWRLAVLKFERLFVTCDATIMYYLWHLFKPRLTRSIFILFSFFSFFLFLHCVCDASSLVAEAVYPSLHRRDVMHMGCGDSCVPSDVRLMYVLVL